MRYQALTTVMVLAACVCCPATSVQAGWLFPWSDDDDECREDRRHCCCCYFLGDLPELAPIVSSVAAQITNQRAIRIDPFQDAPEFEMRVVPKDDAADTQDQCADITNRVDDLEDDLKEVNNALREVSMQLRVLSTNPAPAVRPQDVTPAPNPDPNHTHDADADPNPNPNPNAPAEAIQNPNPAPNG